MADHPDDAQFAGIRGELARLFVAHKADLGMAAASDEFIVEHVVTIARTVMSITNAALATNDEAWMERNRWWVEAGARLSNDESAAPLDG
jgi:hypothetical protein